MDYVYLNFGKENQTPIQSMNVAQAKEYIEQGQFGETDMLPKILAAIAYLEETPNGKVIITALDKTSDVINDKVGTVITK